MTLNDPNCRNCFRFLLLVRVQLFWKYATDLREIYRIASMGVDNTCEMWLRCDRSRDVAMATDFSLLNPHNFFVTVTTCNKLCAVIHDGLDGQKWSVVHEVDRDNFCWQHHYTAEWTLSPWKRTFPPGRFPPPQTFPWHSRATRYSKCCAGRNNWRIHNNKQVTATGWPGGLQRGFALHLVIIKILKIKKTPKRL